MVNPAFKSGRSCMSEKQIEVSVVIPCLNEEETIGACIDKALKFFEQKGVCGEVVVVDNGSTDHSARIAAARGARVVAESLRGYGAAYLCGFREAKGRYLIMGDGDDTYDFSDLEKFIKPLKEGDDLVIGSRFKGKIRKGAMPWMNRYIGNPALSGLCRLFFRTDLSDIHCGMRSFTREAYIKMNLRCLGMEFASEMVMEALQKKLRVREVPVDYYVRKGYSKLEPVKDGWRHLRFMLLFCPTWLYFIPGAAISAVGLIGMLVLLHGPLHFLGHSWDIHVFVLAAFSCILGYQLVLLGLYARTIAIQQGYLQSDVVLGWITKNFKLETGILLGLIFFAAGLFFNVGIFIEWWRSAFGSLYRIRESVAAMTFMILGLQTVFSSFFLSLLAIRR